VVIRRLAVACLAVVGVLCLTGSSDKSFSFDELDTVAEVQTDGSMVVTEAWTYRFDGGPFNFGIRSFDDNLDQIRDFAASDELGALTIIPPNQSISGDWEWELRQPTSDAVVTYVLTYRVVDAIEIGSDVGDLNWSFIGDDHPSVGRMRVTVRLPGSIPAATSATADDDTSVVRGFAHGPLNGTAAVSRSTVVATVDRLAADQFVEVRAIAPADVFDRVGNDPVLADILAEERSLIGTADDDANKRSWGWILTPVLAALGALGAAVLWLVGGREPKSREVQGKYWREPLDEPPAVALANLNRGTVDAGPTVAGTIVDLAQRGYLRIVGEKVERFGPDRTVHHYHWMGKPVDSPDVRQFERDVLELVFRGATQTTSAELTEWAGDNQSAAKKMLDDVTAGVAAEYAARGYEAPASGAKIAVLAAVCAFVGVGSFIVKVATGNWFGWFGVGAAVVLFAAGTRLLSNRTQAGVEAAAKAAGLKKYLEDFSQLEDAPVGHLILWERYLVFAVALGVSGALIRGLAARLPSLATDPNFGTWYVGPHGRFDGFDQIETNGASFAAASTPNSSGGGGGFSGGSSGGGGGGSAGAR
jgi:uncharacterized membrane protein YgcG